MTGAESMAAAPSHSPCVAVTFVFILVGRNQATLTRWKQRRLTHRPHRDRCPPTPDRVRIEALRARHTPRSPTLTHSETRIRWRRWHWLTSLWSRISVVKAQGHPIEWWSGTIWTRGEIGRCVPVFRPQKGELGQPRGSKAAARKQGFRIPEKKYGTRRSCKSKVTRF